MTLNLNRIEAAARAVTPAEWYDQYDDNGFYQVKSCVAPYRSIVFTGWENEDDKAHAAYIAAVSPANILPLIEALKEWRDAVEDFRTQNGFDIGAIDEAEFRLSRAHDALLALIGDDT